MIASEQFLNYFNLIEKYLNGSQSNESFMSFSQKVKNSSNSIVRNHKEELLTFSELRNAIVHNPKIENKVIAEPHEKIVLRIKEIYEKINNPKKVIPTFSFEVLGASVGDSMRQILSEMKKLRFSQFPVYDDSGLVIEIISPNTISRWLSEIIEENGEIVSEKTKVKDLINHIEFKENFKFISRDKSIYDAYNMFIESIENKGRILDAVLITQNGKKTEKLLGLITISDIVIEMKKT